MHSVQRIDRHHKFPAHRVSNNELVNEILRNEYVATVAITYTGGVIPAGARVSAYTGTLLGVPILTFLYRGRAVMACRNQFKPVI